MIIPAGLWGHCHRRRQGVRSVAPSVEREVDRRGVMARQNELNRRHRGWRDLALAGAAAAGVTLLLIAAVGLVWLLGRSPSQTPVLAVQSQSTPTPRALSFIRNTPTPGAPAAEAVPTETPVASAEEEPTNPTPTVVATPIQPAITTESDTTPAN